jgi:hypothetical protein
MSTEAPWIRRVAILRSVPPSPNPPSLRTSLLGLPDALPLVARASSRIGSLLSILVLLAALTPEGASGHARSVSYSNWEFSAEGARVQARISLLELSRLGIPLPVAPDPGDENAGAAVGLYLADHLELFRGGERCQPTGIPVAHPIDDGSVSCRWSLICSASGEQTIRTSILLGEAPSHLHFARLVLPDDEGTPTRILERVLSESAPQWELAADDGVDPSTEPSGTSLGAYLMLGIEHILSGWDHLAFVFALVLLAGSLGEVARLVTGFTIAHSITLALAVLGWVEPLDGPVEAMIGFSVALVALENSWLLAGRRWQIPALAVGGLLVVATVSASGRGSLPAFAALGLALFTASHFGLLRVSRSPVILRVVLAFAFGLVHGFGFAGVLAEMDLPPNRLFTALLGFNLGVEVGQLAVVAIVWPVLAWLRTLAEGRPHRWVVDIAGSAICGLGLFWFLTRAFENGVG